MRRALRRVTFIHMKGSWKKRQQRAMAAGLIAASVMTVGCGGGGGGTAPPSPSSSQTVLAGQYTGTGGNAGFWAAAVSTGPSSYQFYAVNYLGDPATSVVTTLYGGTVLSGLNGDASTGSDFKTMRSGGSVRPSIATFSQTSAAALRADIDQTVSGEPLSVSAVASAGLNAIGGASAWTGRWVDGSNSAASVSLAGLSAGAIITLPNPVISCSEIEVVVGAYQASAGVYPITINIPASIPAPRQPQSNLCLRAGAQLRGLAAVQQVGSVQRLQFVALDVNGSGISFRAER